MKPEEILDYDEYYTDEEQDAYDDGYYDGWRAGILQGRIGALLIFLGCIFLVYLIITS